MPPKTTKRKRDEDEEVDEEEIKKTRNESTESNNDEKNEKEDSNVDNETAESNTNEETNENNDDARENREESSDEVEKKDKYSSRLGTSSSSSSEKKSDLVFGCKYGNDVAIVSTENGTESVVLQISQEKVGQIIGTKGMIIQDIQARSGAKALVNQDFPPGVPREVNISGTSAQVKAAIDLIHRIIEHGPTAIHINSLTGGAFTNTVIECNQQQVSKVIGTGGCNIRDIQAKSGAKIQIEQNFPADVPRQIHISGSSLAVTTAAQLIQNLMNSEGHVLAGNIINSSLNSTLSGVSSTSGSGSSLNADIKFSMDVPKSYVGKLIGKNGETIQMLQRKAGCKMNVDQNVPEGQPCKVNMNGSPHCIDLATRIVQDILKGTQISKIMSMPDYNASAGTGAAGATGAYPYGNLPMGASGSLPYGSPYGLPGNYPGYPYPGYPYPAAPGAPGAPAIPGAPGAPFSAFPYPGYGGSFGFPPAYGGQYPGYGGNVDSASGSGSGSGSSGHGNKGDNYNKNTNKRHHNYGQNQSGSHGQSQSGSGSSGSSGSKNTNSQWSEHRTDDGATYWFNATTGTSQVSFNI